MRLRLERRWEMDAVDVYVYDIAANPTRARILRFLTSDDNQPLLRWDEFDATRSPGPAPSVILPRELLELLVGQAGDFLPPSAAMDVALKDARDTRDRLLGIVERTIDVYTRPQIISAPSSKEENRT